MRSNQCYKTKAIKIPGNDLEFYTLVIRRRQKAKKKVILGICEYKSSIFENKDDAKMLENGNILPWPSQTFEFYCKFGLFLKAA